MEKNGLSILSLLGASLVGGLISYVCFDKTGGTGAVLSTTKPMVLAAHAPICDQRIMRVNGFHLVKPLLSSEPMCSSPRFDGIKDAIGDVVAKFKSEGVVTSASVYLREFKKGEWTVYNENEDYDPGSMLKLPVLLTLLAMSEEQPGFMDHTTVCDRSGSTGKQVFFESQHAEPGRSYTTRQYLELMIVNSDNIATANVMHLMPKDRFIRTFTDLGLPGPDLGAKRYRMTVQDYSVFMKALYNSSYLGPLNSERALDLMARSDFKLGLCAGIPDPVAVAHKFGESGDTQEQQLHETGLVYLPGNTYLITVMTRGNDMTRLPQVLSSISKLVYERMAAN